MGHQTIIFTVILALCVMLSYIAGRLDDKRRASRKIAELEKRRLNCQGSLNKSCSTA